MATQLDDVLRRVNRQVVRRGLLLHVLRGLGKDEKKEKTLCLNPLRFPKVKKG